MRKDCSTFYIVFIALCRNIFSYEAHMITRSFPDLTDFTFLLLMSIYFRFNLFLYIILYIIYYFLIFLTLYLTGFTKDTL